MPLSLHESNGVIITAAAAAATSMRRRESNYLLKKKTSLSLDSIQPLVAGIINNQIQIHTTFQLDPTSIERIVDFCFIFHSSWAIIAQQIPGRTDTDVKNHWNTKLKKKLTDMGIDPVTHKPFSQLAIDYRNIGYDGSNCSDYEAAAISIHTETSASPPSIYYYNHNNTNNNNSQDLKRKKKSRSSAAAAFFAGRAITTESGNTNPSCRQLFMESATAAAAFPPAAIKDRDRDRDHQHQLLAKHNAITSFDMLYHQLRDQTTTTVNSSCGGGDNNRNDRPLLFPFHGGAGAGAVMSSSSPICSFPSSGREEEEGAPAPVLPEPFSWRDFLLDEEISMMQEESGGDQVDNMEINVAGSCSSDVQEEEIDEMVTAGIEVGGEGEEEVSVVVEEEVLERSSFVDQLLGKEKELRLLDDFLGGF